jgi:hypothetical protein
MLGHGSVLGLFSVGQFPRTLGYIIDIYTVDLLRDKECILIWCNADKYFHQYNLKGFSTSMFISEVGEATYCGLSNISQEIVDESNDMFALEMGEVINKPIREIYDNIKQKYGVLVENNPVAHYNWTRFNINE